MKMKLSITLSDSTVRALDKVIGKRGNRSAFIEQAVRDYISQRQRELRGARDRAIYTKHAREYNELAKELLEYQAPIDFEDES
jgi:metal-responsive CopG/Arc/MetJ family transcriptional regulator